MDFVLILALAFVVFSGAAVFLVIGTPLRALFHTPMRIRLVAHEIPGTVQPRVDAFVARGLRVVGSWRVPQMPGMRVVGLLSAQGDVLGIVYRHPIAGTWSDIVVLLADDTSLTVTNSPMAGQMDPPPWSRRIVLVRQPEEALVGCALAEAGEAPRRHLRDDEFAEAFIDAHAREMAWRAGRGGATLEEVSRVAGGEYSPDVVGRTAAVMQRRAAKQVARLEAEAGEPPTEPTH